MFKHNERIEVLTESLSRAYQSLLDSYKEPFGHEKACHSLFNDIACAIHTHKNCLALYSEIKDLNDRIATLHTGVPLSAKEHGAMLWGMRDKNDRLLTLLKTFKVTDPASYDEEEILIVTKIDEDAKERAYRFCDRNGYYK